MSEENEPKEIEPKSSRILFCYFVVVLLLGWCHSNSCEKGLFHGKRVFAVSLVCLLGFVATLKIV